MSQEWVDGSYEAGADDEANEPIEPTGSPGDVDGGDVEGSTFEPEEDVEAP